MRLIRIALGNVNTTVGAVRSNVDRAVELAHAAAKDNATLVAFPEQLVSGYAPEDLVQWRSFVDAQWVELERFAAATKALGCVLVPGVTVARGDGVYNCAALVHRGRIYGLVPKEKLPTYNVFYEGRTFSRGVPGLHDQLHGVPFGDLVFDLDFGCLALEVCEDIWSPDGPMRRRCYAGAELVVNISASPYRLGVYDTRREMISTRAGDNQCVVAYATLVGANDGLIFDGGGFIAQNGRLVHSAPRFVEGITAATVDLDRTARLRREITTWRTDQATFAASAPAILHVKVTEPTSGREALRYPAPPQQSFFLPAPDQPRSRRAEFCNELLDALALGVGDYFEKTGGVQDDRRGAVGWARLAARAHHRASLGACAAGAKPRDVLRAFFMPSRFSSAETRLAAEVAARELDVPLQIVAVDESFAQELAAVEQMLQPGEKLTPMARQNAAGARARRAHVELVELRGRAVLADAQHEREGGRLHAPSAATARARWR